MRNIFLGEHGKTLEVLMNLKAPCSFYLKSVQSMEICDAPQIGLTQLGRADLF